MIFTQGKGTEGTSISKLQKDIKELQTQVEDNAQEITNVDEDLQSYKNIVALQQSEQNTTINTVNDKVTNLQSYTEDYVEQNSELIETQVLRTSEYVETPLLRAVNVQIGETELSDVISDVTTLKEDVSTLKDDVETLKGKADTDEEEIEKLKDRTSILEQKVDTILEQGEIPISTDEVQLGNALISESGNFYYGKRDIPQDNDFKPVAGSIIQPDSSKSVLILKSDNVGYAVTEITADSSDTPVSDIQDGIRLILEQLFEIQKGETLKNIQDSIYLNKTENELEQYSDTVKSLNAGTLKDAIIINDDNVNTFTYNDQLDYLYIVTVDKVFKYENGTLTDVTDTVTTISAHEPFISGQYYYIAYRNYVMSKQFSYEGSAIEHKYDNAKWQYWYKKS